MWPQMVPGNAAIQAGGGKARLWRAAQFAPVGAGSQTAQ